MLNTACYFVEIGKIAIFAFLGPLTVFLTYT